MKSMRWLGLGLFVLVAVGLGASRLSSRESSKTSSQKAAVQKPAGQKALPLRPRRETWNEGGIWLRTWRCARNATRRGTAAAIWTSRGDCKARRSGSCPFTHYELGHART